MFEVNGIQRLTLMAREIARITVIKKETGTDCSKVVERMQTDLAALAYKEQDAIAKAYLDAHPAATHKPKKEPEPEPWSSFCVACGTKHSRKVTTCTDECSKTISRRLYEHNVMSSKALSHVEAAPRP